MVCRWFLSDKSSVILLLFLIAGPVIPSHLSSQEDLKPVIPLGPAEARSGDGFTSLFDLAELPDGRVLVTDNRDRRLSIVDFDDGSVAQLGREGEGPREYRTVFTILPQPAGHFLVYDTRLRRFLVVSPDGSIEGTQPFARPPLSGFSPPRGPDLAGNVYLSHREVGPAGLLPEATLYRWNPSTEELSEIGSVSNYAPGQEGRGFVPMPREDAWTFLPDGSLGLIVAEDYHIEWNGGEDGSLRGPTIPYPRVRVGTREREAWLEGLYSRGSGGTARSSGGGSSSGGSRSQVDPGRFPSIVPPFDGGFIPSSPWREVWVRSEVRSDPSLTVFDILDRRGAHVQTVSVDGDARVVGFGPSAVYLARKDAYDLEWLERYSRITPAG